ncbi:sulfotransferase family 2 domain-containing protein [Bacillus sp. V59.32b]|uniref:sulfotransferase family 2 domain-containing protein n=1 Tax=Bacillus sp. V59.32b TaxID=1758642 RepID=UPI000E3C618E|nr:sulfotransferase family 2 domain-containing protein [Bacillus sp. V59.32b]RFU64583.1 hypothetical protein D0463_09800 [Bacillus sp. V59.32b]
MKNDEKLLIYMHIPKTGGTTMKNIIQKQYDPREVWFHMEKDMLPKLEQKLKKKDLKCVGGHCWYGLHQHFHKPYTYFTMLRDPIDRVVSEYYYILERPHHKAYPAVVTMDLMDFIQEFPLKSSNQHTRRISGNIKSPNLEAAKENIKNDFAIVGLSEMFDESLFLMKKAFGWDDITYQKVNVTKKRPSIEKLPKNVVAELEIRNELDLKLYDFSKKLLLEKIDQLDFRSKRELKNYMNIQN